MTVQRITYRMSDEDWSKFLALQPIVGEAYDFWRALGRKLGFDYRTVMPVAPHAKDRRSFTALPFRHHRKHWCWPLPLKCANQLPQT